jgi:hypothetical protein
MPSHGLLENHSICGEGTTTVGFLQGACDGHGYNKKARSDFLVMWLHLYGIVLDWIGLSQTVGRYTKMILTKRFDTESVGDGFFSSRNASIIRKSVNIFGANCF